MCPADGIHPAAGRSRGHPFRRVQRIALLGGSEALTTEALAWMLTDGGHRVVGTYASVQALANAPKAAHLAPEVVMADSDDPAVGPTMVGQIRDACPRAKILLLCDSVTPPLVRCAIEDHVDGVVLKSDSAKDVMIALGHVLDGRTVMPVGWRQVAAREQLTPLGSLGVRAREILDLAASGLTNNEIATRLTISPNTVKFHLRAAYAQLGVRNRVEAARIAGYSPEASGRRSEG
jgi:two-component system nitrate/nitrite response regulator NarL